jgi:hypothetical protein
MHINICQMEKAMSLINGLVQRRFNLAYDARWIPSGNMKSRHILQQPHEPSILKEL